MSKFLQYVEDVMMVESQIQDLTEAQILEVDEEFQKIEEFLKIGKLGDKLKKFSDKQDEKSEARKKAAKETVEKAKDVAVGITKDVVGGVWKHGKEVAKSHGEIAQAVGKGALEISKDLGSRMAKISSEAKEGLKKMFSKINDASEDQKKVLADLAPLFEKTQAGKTVSGADGLRMLAAVLSMGPSGEIPGYKKYVKKLEELRSVPMFSSYKVSIKKL